MKDTLRLLVTAGLGATAMYYLDPARGRHRRALVRDQLAYAGHKAKRGAGVLGRDMQNRVLGTAADVRSHMQFRQPPDDPLLVDRVRACLGRAVTHPSSILVEAKAGAVTLSGPVLAAEVPRLLDCVRAVRGVMAVHNRLEPHARAGRIPGLQGRPAPRSRARRALIEALWSPTARAGGGLLGGIAALSGFSRRGPVGTLLGTAGLLLFARAATNLEVGRLLGVGGRRHAVEVHKSIRIRAPVAQVFELWDSFENFPSFMTHVRQVRRLPGGEDRPRWRWTVTGPGGSQFEFDSVLTAHEENCLLAWRTEEGAAVQNEGSVTFHDNGDGSTTVNVNLVYTPLVGAVGHAVAWLLGADPKRQMDDDLLRMKTYLETGKAPRDAAAQSRPFGRRTLNGGGASASM